MSISSLPTDSSPTWKNWSENITHNPPGNGADYYFAPKTLADLKQVVAKAAADGVTLRASGQRHSQAPLVVSSNTGSTPSAPLHYLVDMSCYADLDDGKGGVTNIVVDAANKKVQINTGVREDTVDEVLTANNLMMKTVTAGGFFSIGGMTSVDVHGATIKQPIFSGTVSSFTILTADGSVVTIDENTAPVSLQGQSWDPINFARVNLGGLGIVTSVTLDVEARPWATTLKGGTTSFGASKKADFIKEFTAVLTQHDRVESFLNPYADGWITKEYTAVWWDEVANPSNQVPNKPVPAEGACELAGEGEWGASSIPLAWEAGKAAQGSKIGAGLLTAAGMGVIAAQAAAANKKYSDLWLTTATRVMFMSYFIEIGSINDTGLGKVYDALQSVIGRMEPTNKDDFWIAAPMEFRFITGSEVAMAGTYTTNPGSIFVNLDLIGYVEPVASAQYQPELLAFFAGVEQDWVSMGGIPHNGKMYGFYDPQNPTAASTGAFNPNFLTWLRGARGTRLQAFNDYRKSMDPKGIFYNDFLKDLLEG